MMPFIHTNYTCANLYVVLLILRFTVTSGASFIEFPINSPVTVRETKSPVKNETLHKPSIRVNDYHDNNSIASSSVDLSVDHNSLMSFNSEEPIDNSTSDLINGKKLFISNDDPSEEFSIFSSAHASSMNLRPLSSTITKVGTNITVRSPVDVNNTTNEDPHRGIGSSLIPALAFLLSQSYAAYLNETANKKPISANESSSSSVKSVVPNFSHMMALDQDEDLMPSDSLLSPITSSGAASGGVSSFTSWFKNTVLGSKWLAGRKPDDRTNMHLQSQAYQMPYLPHSVPPHRDHYEEHHYPPPPGDPGEYAQGDASGGSAGGGPPPPGGPLHFLPSPEGFPSPYSPHSVMLPPEAMQDTGIMYWLNYIEQASRDREAANNSPPPEKDKTHGATDQSSTERPMGEKPSSSGPKNKFRPNSIRDEIDSAIDSLEGSVDDGGREPPAANNNPHESGKKQGTNKTEASGLLELHSTSSGQQTSAEEPLNTEVTAPRCDKFTSSICIDDFEYPEQAIVDEIYKRREIFELMYSEDGPSAGASASASSPAATGLVDGISAQTEESYSYSPSSPKKISAGYVCPSEVLYGRPKLAKNMANEWKVIVNAGDFTQTLRMEKCLNPNSACSYIMPHLETRCAQVHSIHRLMVFEKGRGFFVESFKIPTGCTCHIVRSKHTPSNKSNRNRNNFDQSHLNSVALSLLQQQQQQQQQQRQPQSSNNNLSTLSNQNSLLAALHGLQQKQALAQRLNQNANSLMGSSSAVPLLDITHANNRPQVSPNRVPANNQVTNSLWSLLMGNALGQSTDRPATSDLLSQLGLLAHLRQLYPDIASQIDPESLLHPKVTSQAVKPSTKRNNNLASMLKGNKNSLSNHLLQQQLQQTQQFQPMQVAQGSSQQMTGTTIVNPLSMGSGGQMPLVQVIHVPVSSSPAIQQNHPSNTLTSSSSSQSLPSASSNPNLISLTSPLLTAYGSQAQANYSRVNYYPHSNQIDSNVEEDEDESDDPNDSSNHFRSLKRNGSVQAPKNVSENVDTRAIASNQTTTASTTDYLANKLKFNHKINFNYHPILEYIPNVSSETPESAPSSSSSSSSTTNDASAPFVPYFPRSYTDDDKKPSPSSTRTPANDSPLNLLNSHLLARNH